MTMVKIWIDTKLAIAREILRLSKLLWKHMCFWIKHPEYWNKYSRVDFERISGCILETIWQWIVILAR